MPRPTPLACLLALLAFSPTTRAADPDLPPGVTQPLVLAPGPGNPRNSEGDFVRLKSGRVLFVYTHFTGGTGDAAAAVLAARHSDDAGRTWSATDEVLVKQLGKQNVMSVSLQRLADGRVGLFYLVKNSKDDCRPFVQYSADEAKTWTDPKPCVPDPVYLVMNNNRVVQLQKTKPGRIVLPVARHDWAKDKKGEHRGVATCYLSDDNGATFRKAESDLEAPPESRSGLQEPLVIELKDGGLLMLCRTDRGSQFRSTSTDGGVTWTPAEPTDIKSPLSPASIARIPKTGDLLMAWNDHAAELDPKFKGKRTPFTVAISRDDGRTWTNRKTLYADPLGWYCYTAIAFADDRVLLGHCAGQQVKGSSGLATTVVTAFDVDWLYR
ncbi:MAG: GH33 / GH93 [uncultured Phycisphaerae bacterium]|uniref:GH33 / GH93 n=1 Tax=uncultured Phycisphaerae bacterium TaxID=904963 RepID=A0A6J4NDC6_9BACT|nr:MAG: GH33 / GH93 [uncultured Phycisphaerae bacterium]